MKTILILFIISLLPLQTFGAQNNDNYVMRGYHNRVASPSGSEANSGSIEDCPSGGCYKNRVHRISDLEKNMHMHMNTVFEGEYDKSIGTGNIDN